MSENPYEAPKGIEPAKLRDNLGCATFAILAAIALVIMALFALAADMYRTP